MRTVRAGPSRLAWASGGAASGGGESWLQTVGAGRRVEARVEPTAGRFGRVCAARCFGSRAAGLAQRHAGGAGGLKEAVTLHALARALAVTL
jgi:hypothetical protein